MKGGIFFQELASFNRKFRRYSKSFFQKKKQSLKSFPPLIANFYENLEDFARGGKALRPFLVYLGYRTVGGKNIPKIMPVCLAYELIHNFLLIHDDVVDQSEIRRGKATIHKRYEKFFGSHYGVSQAIILGDIAFFEAFRLINNTDFDPSLKRRSWDNITLTLLETGYGEALDVEYSYKKANLASIWQVTDLKSARYSFVGPLTLGAILAGAGSAKLAKIAQFGRFLGLAYQLHDDILGVFGQEKVTGKSSLSDLCEGKNTVLVYKALQLAKGKSRLTLARLWGKKQATKADLETVRAIIKKSGASKWAQGQKQKLAKLAQKVIQSQTFDSKLQKLYGHLVEFAIKRQN